MKNPVYEMLSDQVEAATKAIETIEQHANITNHPETIEQLKVLHDLQHDYHRLADKLRDAQKMFR